MNCLIPLIPAFPLLGFILTIFWGRKLPGHGSLIPMVCSGISLAISLAVVASVLGGARYDVNLNWFVIGDLHLTIGFSVDELASLMLLVVSVVGFLVILYSTGYMHGDARFSRYFGFISLFLFSMYGLVLSNTFFMLFMFWELVGLCSYLLIGFWFEKKSASDAGKKAFITTRIGDLGFMVGIFFFVKATGSFRLADVFAAVQSGALDPRYITIAAICLFGGAVGKSAQFPLHVWLPDAMEGPTPVSALIHAATMVAAGVYMIARCFPIYAASPDASMFVATAGGITAIMAATIACTQFDIKRILAYSTLSQLGYMVFALGSGGYTAGMFHLMTHAFFKALLFLGSGSVIHALHTQDIREMGGLHKQMKITSTTFIIAALALSGVPPLSGFWSKDEILSHCLTQGHTTLYVLGTIGAFLTSFYMFRLCFMVFLGNPRTGKIAKESPRTMTVPLIILGVLSVVAGFVGMPWLPHNIGTFIHFGEVEEAAPNFMVMGISTAVGLLGIWLSYMIYLRGKISPASFSKRFPWLYRLLYNKYYVDEIYMVLVIRPLMRLTKLLFSFDFHVIDGAVNGTARLTLILSRVKRWVDEHIVDGLVNGVGRLTQAWSWALRRVQSGYVQQYVVVILLGILFMLAVKLLV